MVRLPLVGITRGRSVPPDTTNFYGEGMEADPVAEWLKGAADGDTRAWDALVQRYANLVWAVARSHRLSPADAADVSQTTWLRLVEHLDRIKQPERLGAWLATTARRESLGAIRRGARHVAFGTVEDLGPSSLDEPPPDGALIAAAEHSALGQAFGRMAERCQRLLRVLMSDPPPAYEEVSEALGMPIGSIGPTRARCLERLQREVQIAGI
jgi:RNA polymerase sigma factor (sigma-70 family)